MIPKESDHTDRDAEEQSGATPQESDHTNAEADAQSRATPHVELADGSPLPSAAFHRVVDEVTADGDGELGRALVIWWASVLTRCLLAPALISEGRHRSSNSIGVVTGDKDSSGLSLPTLLNYYFN
jgi:hypothetical protein